MKKEKMFLIVGTVAFFYGSCMIHFGLGLMLLGALLILFSYIEFNENHKTEEEDKQ